WTSALFAAARLTGSATIGACADFGREPGSGKAGAGGAALAGAAPIGCGCGKFFGWADAGAAVAMGRRSPLSRRLIFGYSTSAARCVCSGASIDQAVASTER